MSTIIKKSTRIGVNALFDHLKAVHKWQFDAALARSLALAPAMISKLRSGSPMTPAVALRIHECTGMPLRDIYEVASRTEKR